MIDIFLFLQWMPQCVKNELCVIVFEGHSAKYGSYTMMDLEMNTIVDLHLVQVSEKPFFIFFGCKKKNVIVQHFFDRVTKWEGATTWRKKVWREALTFWMLVV